MAAGADGAIYGITRSKATAFAAAH
jgi:hypothetical protein